MAETTIISLVMVSLAWATCLLITAWLSRAHEREIVKASSSHEFQMMVLVQTMVIGMSADDPYKTAMAIDAIQTPVPDEDPVEHPDAAPPIVGIRLNDGTKIDLIGDIDTNTLNGIDERYLVRRGDS